MKKNTNATVAARTKALLLAMALSMALAPATPALAATAAPAARPALSAQASVLDGVVSWLRGFRWAVASARISHGRGTRAALDVFWVTDRQATGYQVRYCTRKDMRGARTVSCGRGSHRHVGGLRRNSWYYVQVRKVHREHGRVYYSNWSARMIVRTR